MSTIINVTDSNFDAEVLKSDLIVVVDFWAEWCGPCRMVAPHMESIAQEYADQVKVVKLNLDHNPNMAIQYSVLGIPTVIVFKNGIEVERLMGARPKSAYISKIAPYFH
ncbi:MAG: thioredoxin [Anaerolineaceae bacterium 4572_78]|nr:MAG: thioredoxin [Anaerolineaceae bacterium 4572_78]